jgi:glucuronate isomerase
MDCGFLARLVAEHRLDEDEAREVVVALAYDLPKRAYRLDAPPLPSDAQRSKAA